MDQDEILLGKHTLVFIHTETPFLEQQKQQAPDLTEQTFVLTKEQLEQRREQSGAKDLDRTTGMSR